ncbi:membrane protein insertion efficiency factor YidD [Desertivirga xinjiangensis]|uniref:membrane protein insertion efficiency factor YidD n=1 Tax=Desertivirga xinjiangensis TaxID=539206 RepID=UPI002109E573|nr:membrane protein insertion efficiency factor YidD [Pedobacter xinjiangensis]
MYRLSHLIITSSIGIGCFNLTYAQTFTSKVDGNSLTSRVSYSSEKIQTKESSTEDYIRFYQNYISEIRGQECPMYPSCSNFGLKSFKETNFLHAFLLTSDRLLRCGHDHKNYALTLQENGFKNIDFPVYQQTPANLYFKRKLPTFAYSDAQPDSSVKNTLIKSLINDGLYHEAIIELKRIRLSTGRLSEELFLNELICFNALGEFEKALYSYEIHCSPEYKDNPEVLYQIATIQYKLNNFQESLKIADRLERKPSDEFMKTKVALLKVSNYSQLHDWENSRSTLQSLKGLPFPDKTRDGKISVLDASLPLKEKKPAVAAAISIVPGAGYAYAGHRQTALSAFIINGLLTYATYSNFSKKNIGMGLLTGVFNLSFYIGNIYGASKSAQRYNQRQKEDLKNKLLFNIQP